MLRPSFTPAQLRRLSERDFDAHVRVVEAERSRRKEDQQKRIKAEQALSALGITKKDYASLFGFEDMPEIKLTRQFPNRLVHPETGQLTKPAPARPGCRSGSGRAAALKS